MTDMVHMRRQNTLKLRAIEVVSMYEAVLSYLEPYAMK